jgi:hypothetical protein
VVEFNEAFSHNKPVSVFFARGHHARRPLS